MDINQNINYQKQAIDLSQFTLKKQLPKNGITAPQVENNKILADPPIGASFVSLSEEGRAASFTVDFYATSDNLLKLSALENSESFAKAHSAISYETVKNLLA